jgi:hypothetical protein
MGLSYSFVPALFQCLKFLFVISSIVASTFVFDSATFIASFTVLISTQQNPERKIMSKVEYLQTKDGRQILSGFLF